MVYAYELRWIGFCGRQEILIDNNTQLPGKSKVTVLYKNTLLLLALTIAGKQTGGPSPDIPDGSGPLCRSFIILFRWQQDGAANFCGSRGIRQVGEQACGIRRRRRNRARGQAQRGNRRFSIVVVKNGDRGGPGPGIAGIPGRNFTAESAMDRASSSAQTPPSRMITAQSMLI